MSYFFPEMNMLRNILQVRNVLLSNHQNMTKTKTVTDFQQDLIRMPPSRIRFAKSKVLFVIASGVSLGAYSASCLVSVLESFDFYPDAADDDDY